MALSKPVQTRQMLECPIFGSFSELSDLALPTYKDVMKCYCFIRHNLKAASEKDPGVSEITEILIPKIERIWSKASIPIVSNLRISQMIKVYHGKYRNLLRSKGRKGSDKFESNLATFKAEAERLFDIAACKCQNIAVCNCSKEKKIPVLEQEFLEDQRSNRKMVISNIDRATTITWQKRGA